MLNEGQAYRLIPLHIPVKFRWTIPLTAEVEVIQTGE